jgi:hypothetical protein
MQRLQIEAFQENDPGINMKNGPKVNRSLALVKPN